jgi:hypothetical protein
MLKNKLLVVIVFFIAMYLKPFSTFSQQEFKGSVGVRFGYGIGLTGTYHLQNNQNIEFLLRYGYHGLILNRPGLNFQALYEKHWQLRSSNFTAYVGGGPAIGAGKRSSNSPTVYFVLGASPILGFDYTTQRTKVPFILALDYKPTFNVDMPMKKGVKTDVNFSYYEIAFSVRVGIGRMGRNYKKYRRR